MKNLNSTKSFAFLVFISVAFIALNLWSDYGIAIKYNAQETIVTVIIAQLFSIAVLAIWYGAGYLICNITIFFLRIYNPIKIVNIHITIMFSVGTIVGIILFPVTPKLIVEMILTG